MRRMFQRLRLWCNVLSSWKTYVYGLAPGGEDGVSHVLRALVEDLCLTLHLSGIPSVSRDVLNRKLPLREDEL